MVSTYTTNKYLEEPGHNDYVNTWDNPLNTNFSRLDAALGGVTSINLNGVSGTLDLTNAYPLPSSAPYSYIGAMFNLSGTPTNNVIIRIPSGVGGIWSIYAGFSGNYTVTFSSLGGGTSVALAQGYNNQVMSDGTNIRLLSLGGRTIGTAANNLVALDASAKLPAVDGSQLTNLPSSFPSGTMNPYAGLTEPSGWLFCDGRSLSTTTYAALYAAIGTTYGSVGAGYFNIPDARGRVLVGRDDMGTMGTANRITTAGSGISGTTLGASGGEQAHTLTTSEIPAHTHTFLINNRDYSGSGGSNANYQAGAAGSTITTSSTGGGLGHNNVQPTIIVNMIIKT